MTEVEMVLGAVLAIELEAGVVVVVGGVEVYVVAVGVEGILVVE